MTSLYAIALWHANDERCGKLSLCLLLCARPLQRKPAKHLSAIMESQAEVLPLLFTRLDESVNSLGSGDWSAAMRSIGVMSVCSLGVNQAKVDG